jgi:hypothetical protein
VHEGETGTGCALWRVRGDGAASVLTSGNKPLTSVSNRLILEFTVTHWAVATLAVVSVQLQQHVFLVPMSGSTWPRPSTLSSDSVPPTITGTGAAYSSVCKACAITRDGTL